jgi:hypothetical protein
MIERQRIQSSFEAFEKLLEDFARNSDQQDADWRRKLVELRRQLQERLIGMRAALQAHEARAGSSSDARNLSAALSTIRSEIALHQAEGPAVAIDTSDEGYRRSVRQLRAATRRFRATARIAIASLRP